MSFPFDFIRESKLMFPSGSQIKLQSDLWIYIRKTRKLLVSRKGYYFMCLIFLMGMVPLIIGLINLFAPDIAWTITEFGNEVRGVDSKRTETWEMLRPINGILLILTALFTFMFLMPLSQMRQTPYKRETTSTNQLITPTATECTNVKELKYIDNTGKIAVTRIEFCP